MTRTRVTSGSPYEAMIGFSRAVRVGNQVFVSQTAPIPTGDGEPPRDTYGQARRCLEIIVAALVDAGARPEDVVSTRVYLSPTGDHAEAARAHAEVFGDIRPANAFVFCATPVDTRFLVEIEAHAIVSE
jgi:enamine deaminase RidA (YjgF/YER057c/UK114 family)